MCSVNGAESMGFYITNFPPLTDSVQPLHHKVASHYFGFCFSVLSHFMFPTLVRAWNNRQAIRSRSYPVQLNDARVIRHSQSFM